MLRALCISRRVVPGPVQVRVVVLLGAALALALSPLGLLARWPLGAAAALLLLWGGGLYVAWCLWPRLRLGVAAALLGELPQPPGQAVRLSFDDGPTPGVTDA